MTSTPLPQLYLGWPSSDRKPVHPIPRPPPTLARVRCLYIVNLVEENLKENSKRTNNRFARHRRTEFEFHI